MKCNITTQWTNFKLMLLNSNKCHPSSNKCLNNMELINNQCSQCSNNSSPLINSVVGCRTNSWLGNKCQWAKCLHNKTNSKQGQMVVPIHLPLLVLQDRRMSQASCRRNKNSKKTKEMSSLMTWWTSKRKTFHLEEASRVTMNSPLINLKEANIAILLTTAITQVEVDLQNTQQVSNKITTIKEPKSLKIYSV
jgi:hypothetical protein